MLVFVLQRFSLHWDHVIFSVSIDFPSYSHRDTPYHRIAYDCYPADWDSLHDHLSDVQWEDIFNKLSASATASELCESVEVEIYIYIPC